MECPVIECRTIKHTVKGFANVPSWHVLKINTPIRDPNVQSMLKLIKDKRLTTPIFTHFEIQASWRYSSVLSLTGLKRSDYVLPEIMSRPSKVAFMSF